MWIITGANGKLGRRFLDSLVSEGYFVYAVDLKLNLEINNEIQILYKKFPLTF